MKRRMVYCASSRRDSRGSQRGKRTAAASSGTQTPADVCVLPGQRYLVRWRYVDVAGDPLVCSANDQKRDADGHHGFLLDAANGALLLFEYHAGGSPGLQTDQRDRRSTEWRYGRTGTV